MFQFQFRAGGKKTKNNEQLDTGTLQDWNKKTHSEENMGPENNEEAGAPNAT